MLVSKGLSIQKLELLLKESLIQLQLKKLEKFIKLFVIKANSSYLVLLLKIIVYILVIKKIELIRFYLITWLY